MGETWDKLLRKRRENCQTLDDDDDDDDDDDVDGDGDDDDDVDDYSGKDKILPKAWWWIWQQLLLRTWSIVESKCLYSLLISPKHQKMTHIYFKTSKKTSIDDDTTMATR